MQCTLIFPRIMGLRYSNVPWSGVSGSPIRWLENVNHGTSQLRHDVTKLWHSGHTCNSRSTWRPSYISSPILSRSMTAFIYPLITSRYYSLHTCLLLRSVFRSHNHIRDGKVQVVVWRSNGFPQFQTWCATNLHLHRRRVRQREPLHQPRHLRGGICQPVQRWGMRCVPIVTVWCAVQSNAKHQLNCRSNVQISQFSNK